MLTSVCSAMVKLWIDRLHSLVNRLFADLPALFNVFCNSYTSQHKKKTPSGGVRRGRRGGEGGGLTNERPGSEGQGKVKTL